MKIVTDIDNDDYRWGYC